MLRKSVPRRRVGPAAPLTLLAVAVVAAMALIPMMTPAPRGADTPAADFASARALAHVERIAAEPRPTGSAANARVREYLVGQLAALGLDPRVQDTTAQRVWPSGAHLGGRVHNIRATLPGTGGTGRVLLVAHYDSVVLGPGATDDGMAVATILETMRALTAAQAPHNTVEVLLTDAEEPGQLGAQAFADSPDSGDRARTVVLNLEARGTEGRLVMFETGPHTAAVVPNLTGSLPFTTSTSDEIYEVLPNDTDFTVFKEAGFTGMNFAVVDGSARYDTPLDDLANLSPESLQDMGNAVLAATRALGAAELDLAGAGEITYFTAFGVLLRYPQELGLVLAGLSALGLGAVLWRRRDTARPSQVGAVSGLVLVPVLGSAVLGWLGWQALTLVAPAYANFEFGDPYRPELPTAGFAVLGLVCCAAWLRWVRRRWSAPVVAAAAATWFAVLGLLAAVLLPGAAYLFTWPALFAVAGLALLPAEGSPWRPLALSAAAFPAVALVLPLLVVLLPTVGLALIAVTMLLLALILLPALPAVPRIPRSALAAAVVAGLLLVAAGPLTDRTDAAHPAQLSLSYTKDVDTGATALRSPTPAGEPWLDRQLTGAPETVSETFPGLPTEPLRQGPARDAVIPVPRAEVVEQTAEGEVRTVTLRISPAEAEATAMSVYAATGMTSVRLNGRELPAEDNRDAGNQWRWAMHYVAPDEGFTLTVSFRGAHLPLRLVAWGATVPDAALPARPDAVTWSAGGFGQTQAVRQLTL
ncbi:M20/M25/M40 family metallo-hydrolase [Saccharopolyspora indica]|uniref:M20/M25/M40 family metallo-hydrolase n=1 Tax=Saccharopolyspora indica TaxID=1229659 RepID=UPI0022EA1C1A|nr:M20/M25/M40 family metallo-hydrolase [Saccharopolyspora indica]MDA3648003.1 M20/M25/M40 family metallo-hydrolase [Saccharopolyspora indica]